ncbi:MAG TPA: hypothetical protein VKZ53_23660 [Candidatus Angelobacter sp.]|nr:hypothetical protein [Candidatus Angelobacter sp.]
MPRTRTLVLPIIRMVLLYSLFLSLLLAGTAMHSNTMPVKDTARQQQIWFVTSPMRDTNLFEENAPWANAALKVQVMKTYISFLNRASDSDLSNYFRFLKTHNMAFSVEFGILNQIDKCGVGIEGFAGGGAKAAAALAQRIKRLGGEIAYVAMDEPFWNGHWHSGPAECKWTPEQIAENAKSTVEAFRAVFPNVAFGDIEPITDAPEGDLLSQYAEWTTAWQKIIGTKLAFFHADVVWRSNNVATLSKFGQMLQQKAIAFGVIYNGEPNDLSDKMWLDNARNHIVSFEDGASPLPDHVIFQTWNPYPRRYLPEWEPDTFTHLILEYFRKRTRISGAGRTADSIFGRLLSEDGSPVAGGTVSLEGLDNAGVHSYEQMVRGNIPTQATKALIGWRVNTECGCNGQADLSVAPPLFRRESGATVAGDLGILGSYPGDKFQPLRERDGRSNAVHLRAVPGQQLIANGQRFDVEGGKPFAFSVSYAVKGPTSDAISVNLIFFDATGRESTRYGVRLTPQWFQLAMERTERTERTDSGGNFSIRGKTTSGANMRFRLVFAGNDEYRSVSQAMP